MTSMLESKLRRDVLHRLEADADELLELQAELGTATDVVAVHAAGEALFLEAFHNVGHVKRRQLLGRVDQDGGGDQARESLDGEEGLVEEALARKTESLVVRLDSIDHRRAYPARGEHLRAHDAVLHKVVFGGLVVNVVKEARQAPGLLILAQATRPGAHHPLRG